MKPIIAESVYNTLCGVTHLQKNPEALRLSEKLASSEIVDDLILTDKTVSLNSKVDYICEPAWRPIRIKIVLPEEADLSQRKISVLAPISRALLGFKESDEFIAEMPSGKKKIRILKVQNQEQV